jgi:hypothetical protein
MPPFLVLQPQYPHDSASNSLFNVKKGEILECPAGYKPSDSFQVCDTREAAEEYIKLAGGEEATYQLFSRDIHRFLSREEKEILLDIRSINMHHNTAAKILDYERLHFTRKAVMDILEAIIKKSEVSKEKKNKEMLHA